MSEKEKGQKEKVPANKSIAPDGAPPPNWGCLVTPLLAPVLILRCESDLYKYKSCSEKLDILWHLQQLLQVGSQLRGQFKKKKLILGHSDLILFLFQFVNCVIFENNISNCGPFWKLWDGGECFRTPHSTQPPGYGPVVTDGLYHILWWHQLRSHKTNLDIYFK